MRKYESDYAWWGFIPEKKTLIYRVSNKFINMAVQVGHTIHTWCSKKVSQFRQCKEEMSGTGKIGGHSFAARARATGRLVYRTPFPVFATCPEDVFYLLGGRTWENIKRTDGEAVRRRAVVEHMLEWNVWSQAIEAVGSAPNFRKKVYQILKDSFIMHKRAARDALLQSLQYHRLVSRWSGRTSEEIEERRHAV